MSSNHWYFVAASYAVFFVLIIIDWASSALSKRHLERELRARLRRESALKEQHAQNEPL
jgi:heme exporter protein CcmD